MSSRPSSRATPGEENTSTLRSSTAKRPLTKPVAPRLSTSSSATKPTSTSTARSTTTASTSLSKPPARPTVATSTVRRPPSSTATTASSAHRARPSSASVEASGDESQRDGIAAKPKRMSITSAPSTERTTSTTGKATATPVKRSTASTTSTTARPSVKSPTATTKTSATPTSRTPSTLASRTRPLSTSTARAASGIADRKRLSTIPASPAVKKVSAETDEIKENEIESESEQAGPVEAGHVSLDGPSENEKAAVKNGIQDEISRLKEELEESRGQVQQLKSHLAETKARMEYFSENIEQEAGKVQEATEAIRAEHASKIGEMLALHKTQIEQLETLHKKEAEEVLQKHEMELHDAEKLRQKDLSNKDAELDALRAELDPVKANETTSPEPVVSEESELAKTRTQLEAMRERHQAAKNNAKDKMAKVLGDYRQEIVGLKSQHAEKIEEMQRQIDGLQSRDPIPDDELTREKEAHAETLQQLQAAKNELDTIRNASQESSNVESQSMQEMKERLQSLEKSKANDSTLAERHLDELKSNHAMQISEIRSALEKAKAKIENREGSTLEQSSNTSYDLADELALAFANLQSAQSEMIADFEAQLQDAEKTTDSMKESHAKEVSALRAQLDEASTVSDQQKDEQIEKVRGLELQLSSKDQKFEALKTSHAEQLTKLQAESDASSISKIDSLKQAHANEISKLEERSRSALRDLETLETSNTTYIEQIKSDANVAQKKALEEQASSHKEAVSILQQKLSAMQEETIKLKQAHERELDQLKSSNTQDREGALAELTSKHERQLADLQSQSKTSSDTLEKLKSSHTAEIQKLESQAKSTAGELDAAKFQAQSLKGIMQSMEKEFAEKEEEHQKELEKRDSDFSQAVGKLSSQSMRIAELETAHRQAVEQAKAAVEAETEASLQTLKEEHDEALATLRKALEENHHEFLLTLRSEHSSAIESLSKEVDTRDHDIEHLKKQHAQALVDLHASAQKGNDKAMEQLKNEHNVALDDLRTNLRKEHEFFVDGLREQHAADVAETSTKHESSMSRIKSEHADIVATLQADLEQIREKLRDTSELDTLRAQLSASQQAMSNLQQEQATTMSSMTKEHAEELNSLKSKLKSLKDEANKPVETTEIDSLKAELAESKGKIADLANSHAEAIATKDLEHASAVKNLQSELDQAKDSLSVAMQGSGEAEEIKSLLADAKQTIAELSEQYALASVEAENQRLAAEGAKNELAELKKGLSQAQTVPTNTTESTDANVKSSNGTSGTKPGPKAGLKASKWATTEPEEQMVSSPTTASNDHQEGLDTRGVVSESGDAQTPRQKRNVAGQMAGIKEQIRQLSEMNDEFLDDHQKWARSLSRVDDDGTVTVSEAAEETQDGEATK